MTDAFEQAIEESAGVSVYIRKTLPDGIALAVRVDPRSQDTWHDFIKYATYRAAAAAVEVEDGQETPWTVEFAKIFYYDAEADDTRWLWRITLRGDTAELAGVLARTDFTTPKMMLTSIPLVGRVIGRPGKLKGLHRLGQAEGYVNREAQR